MTAGPFDSAVLESDPERRRQVLDWLAAGLAAADPAEAVRRHVTPHQVAGTPLTGTVAVLAVGKASESMASALGERLRGRLDQGLLVTPAPVTPVPGFRSIVAGHPLPDVGSLEAGAAALELARSLGDGDTLVVLLSGGASALLEHPIDGVTLTELAHVTDTLLRGGASIDELNLVRRHLSAVKGGGLAAATAATVVTLALSDVVGSSPHVIGSGPTVPDPSDVGDARQVLRAHGMDQHLLSGARSKTVAPGDFLVVGDGPGSAEAVAAAARASGLRAEAEPAPLTGDAATEARRCVSVRRPGVTVWAGETTVRVDGNGRGGRNQEAALAAAIELDGATDVLFAALATDGVDGPTDAAGGLVDGATAGVARAAGLDADDHLRRHDSHPWLAGAGALLRTGPTGTNVGDIWILWRDQSAAEK